MLPVVTHPWAPYAPDLSTYLPSYSDAILNVQPTEGGYRSLPGFDAIGNASLGAAPKGGRTVRKTDGTTAVYAGTTAKLYRFNASTTSFDDVTRSSGGDYAVPTGGLWSAKQFGEFMIMCNGVDATQYIDVDSGTNFAALSNAPIATHVNVIGDFVLLGKLSTNRRAVAWSGVNDATHWTYGSRGSDQQIFPDAGAVQNTVAFETGAVILQEEKIRILERSYDTNVFRSTVKHENIGCFAPYSVASVQNTFFWYGQGGFYAGLDAEPIGENRVNKFVETIADALNRSRMVATVDPIRKIVWWSIPTAPGTRIMLGYQWIVRQWTRAEMNVDVIFQAIPPGYTFNTWDELAATFDDLPYVFDSEVWSGGGNLVMAGFQSDGTFGYFQGPALDATLETADIELNQNGYAFTNGFRLITDALVENVSGKIATRRHHGAMPDWSDIKAANSNTGAIWIRKRGMTHRFQASIASHAWEHTNGIHAMAKNAGWR